MSIEGRLLIDLAARPARITSTRPAGRVAGLLCGRRREEVAPLLRQIFALCGEAHSAAAGLALAGRIGAGPVRVVLAETAREHLLRILTGWRPADAPPLPALPVMALVETARSGRDAAGPLAAYLRDYVLGTSPEDFLALADMAGLHRWLADAGTVPARWLAAIMRQGQAGLGVVTPAFLPDMPPRDLAPRLREPAFAATPDWDGPRETGPLARRHAHPLVEAAISAHGAGLLARLLARLVELAALPGEIAAARARTAPAPGLGVVETARGRLIHHARLDGERVAEYVILAPTEWNFHPHGVAARALTGLAPGPARAVIEAIDPCVDYELRAA